jgi:hypothetical protein
MAGLADADAINLFRDIGLCCNIWTQYLVHLPRPDPQVISARYLGEIMYQKLFGIDRRAAKPADKDVPTARGLEVVEDDPDTVWGMWNEAVANQDSRHGGLSSTASHAAGEPESARDHGPSTVPMTLEDKTIEQRISDALGIVQTHHARIANTIRTLWGDKECAVYVNKLIMSGGDGMGHARVGFNQDAVAAMMELSDVHEILFGPPEFTGTGFGDFKR